VHFPIAAAVRTSIMPRSPTFVSPRGRHAFQCSTSFTPFAQRSSGPAHPVDEPAFRSRTCQPRGGMVLAAPAHAVETLCSHRNRSEPRDAIVEAMITRTTYRATAQVPMRLATGIVTAAFSPSTLNKVLGWKPVLRAPPSHLLASDRSPKRLARLEITYTSAIAIRERGLMGHRNFIPPRNLLHSWQAGLNVTTTRDHDHVAPSPILSAAPGSNGDRDISSHTSRQCPTSF